MPSTTKTPVSVRSTEASARLAPLGLIAAEMTMATQPASTTSARRITARPIQAALDCMNPGFPVVFSLGLPARSARPGIDQRSAASRMGTEPNTKKTLGSSSASRMTKAYHQRIVATRGTAIGMNVTPMLESCEPAQPPSLTRRAPIDTCR